MDDGREYDLESGRDDYEELMHAGLSLTPGFGRVIDQRMARNRLNGLVAGDKPLKRFADTNRATTRLKPGAKESFANQGCYYP